MPKTGVCLPSRSRNRMFVCDWSSGVCSADLGALSHLATEVGNSATARPARGARMPARGTEGRGGVVAKGRAVMARTGRRSARVSPRKAELTDEGRKADDGRLALLVRLSMGNHKSALREYLDPTGKRSAVKVACCVWSRAEERRVGKERRSRWYAYQ